MQLFDHVGGKGRIADSSLFVTPRTRCYSSLLVGEHRFEGVSLHVEVGTLLDALARVADVGVVGVQHTLHKLMDCLEGEIVSSSLLGSERTPIIADLAASNSHQHDIDRRIGEFGLKEE